MTPASGVAGDWEEAEFYAKTLAVAVAAGGRLDELDWFGCSCPTPASATGFDGGFAVGHERYSGMTGAGQ